MADRIDEALQLSEEILCGIETETISISSAALRCLRLARLISDLEEIEWLQYETTGYPQDKDGKIPGEAWKIGSQHGREECVENGKRIFTEVADELEANIDSYKSNMNTITTNGVSLSGDYVGAALRNLQDNITARTNFLMRAVANCQRKLTILRGQYYAFTVRVNLELKFSQSAEDVFRTYRMNVDSELVDLAPEAIKRFVVAYERLKSDNSESWAQALTSCRRVLQEISDALFKQHFPTYIEKTFKTRSGKVLDISGERYLNRVFAVLDKLDNSTANRLVGSHIMYNIDWVETMHNMLCKGVHDVDRPLTFEEARTAILHTYIALGDLVTALRDVMTE